MQRLTRRVLGLMLAFFVSADGVEPEAKMVVLLGPKLEPSVRTRVARVRIPPGTTKGQPVVAKDNQNGMTVSFESPADTNTEEGLEVKVSYKAPRFGRRAVHALQRLLNQHVQFSGSGFLVAEDGVMGSRTLGSFIAMTTQAGDPNNMPILHSFDRHSPHSPPSDTHCNDDHHHDHHHHRPETLGDAVSQWDPWRMEGVMREWLNNRTRTSLDHLRPGDVITVPPAHVRMAKCVRVVGDTKKSVMLRLVPPPLQGIAQKRLREEQGRRPGDPGDRTLGILSRNTKGGEWRWVDLDFPWLTHEAHRMFRDVAAMIASRECRSVLDVGCYGGELSKYFDSTQLDRYIGFDISPHAIEVARSNSDADAFSCSFFVANALSALSSEFRKPPGDRIRTIDAIYFGATLGYIADSLEEAVEVVKKYIHRFSPKLVVIQEPAGGELDILQGLESLGRVGRLVEAVCEDYRGLGMFPKRVILALVPFSKESGDADDADAGAGGEAELVNWLRVRKFIKGQ